MRPDLPNHQVATATYALQLIAKSLNQAGDHLGEIGDQIPELHRDDAIRLARRLAVQGDRLNELHNRLTHLIEQLVKHGGVKHGGQKGELPVEPEPVEPEPVEPPEPEEPEDPMRGKDPWETDYPQIASYLWHLDVDR